MSAIDRILKLAEMGYRVVPLLPGEKHPNGLLVKNGRNDASNDPETIRKWFKRYPMSNWGLVTDGLIVVDVDGKDNPWPVDPDRCAELANAGAIAVTGRNGRHYFYRQPAGHSHRNTTAQLGEHVDTRANGGYVVLPGSTVTKDGKAGVYQWVDGCELDKPVGDLPEPPQWLMDELAKPKARGSGNFTPGADGVIGEGRRNQTLFSLGSAMRRNGLDFDEILALLIVANKKRCQPPLDDKEVESIAESATKYEPDQMATDMATGAVDDVDIGGLVNEAEGHEIEEVPTWGSVDPGEFPKHLLDVPGFVSKFMRYALDLGQREGGEMIALASALSMQSYLAGRRVMDSNGTRPNIISMVVANSGFGKEAGREAIKNTMLAIGRGKACFDKVASKQGYFTALVNHPRAMFLMDEIGRWLCAINGPKAHPQLKDIISIIMECHTSSNSQVSNDARADGDTNKTIYQPNAVVMGSSTPGRFFESLSFDMIEDGFLGRVFVFEMVTENGNIPKAKWRSAFDPPAEMVDSMREWIRNPDGNDFSDTPFDTHPKLTVLEFGDGAIDLLDNFRTACDREHDADKTRFRALWTRAGEKAAKFALLYTCSQMRSPNEPIPISADAVRWGCAMSEYLTRRLVFLATQNIANGEHDKLSKVILRFIAESGAKGVSLTEISDHIGNIKPPVRNMVLTDLEHGLNKVISKSFNPAGKGRPRKVYFLRCFVKK